MQRNKLGFRKGFTLIELLVVIVIIGILATVGLASFNSSQMKGRDSKRKSDLKEVAAALELYYSDNGEYPSSNNGQIAACPSNTKPGTPCVWGSSEFTDGKTIYMKEVPDDPRSSSYFYRTVILNSVDRQAFQLYAHLENSEDLDCIPDRNGIPNCNSSELPTIPPVPSCTSGTTTGVNATITCNFAVTSPNVSPSENGDSGGADVE